MGKKMSKGESDDWSEWITARTQQACSIAGRRTEPWAAPTKTLTPCADRLRYFCAQLQYSYCTRTFITISIDIIIVII